MEKLAILGGTPVFKEVLPMTNNIGIEEKNEVLKVLDSGMLSDFLAKSGDHFLGGKEVLEFEDDFKKKFGVKYAVSFNSATTALDATVCCLDLNPGEEVIVSPYTMSASATAVLMNNAIPVFADIEEDTFCLDVNSIKERITNKTRAIIVTNLFGGSARYDEILEIAKKFNLKIIEDNAQAFGGVYNNRYLGTIGDVGVFSFNRHKIIQCGEGGILITNNEKYAFKASLKRNHGEVILDDLNIEDDFVLGSNYRLTEVNAAISKVQLRKLDFLNEKRISLANYLSEKLKEFEGLTPAYVLENSKHVYYLYPIKFNENKIGISRELFAKAMEKEGFKLNQGYLKPLYLIPLFQKKQTYKNSGYPFTLNNNQNYSKGICPVAEKFYEKELLLTDICRYPLERKHIDLFVEAIKKIFSNREELKRLE